MSLLARGFQHRTSTSVFATRGPGASQRGASRLAALAPPAMPSPARAVRGHSAARTRPSGTATRSRCPASSARTARRGSTIGAGRASAPRSRTSPRGGTAPWSSRGATTPPPPTSPGSSTSSRSSARSSARAAGSGSWARASRHQLVARALGGEAGPNPSGAFVLRRETIRCEDALLRRADFIAAWERTRGSGAAEPGNNKSPPSSQEAPRVRIPDGECVLAPPRSATVRARSDAAEVEMFARARRRLVLAGPPGTPGPRDAREDPPARPGQSLRRGQSRGEVALPLRHGRARVRRDGACAPQRRNRTRRRRRRKIGRRRASSSTTSDVAASETRARLEARAPPRAPFTKRLPPWRGGSYYSFGRAIVVGATDDFDDAAAASNTPRIGYARSPRTRSPRRRRRRGRGRLVADEIGALAALNGATAGTYAELGEQAAGLVVFADSLRRRDESLAPHLEKLGGSSGSVRALEEVAAKLDDHARARGEVREAGESRRRRREVRGGVCVFGGVTREWREDSGGFEGGNEGANGERGPVLKFPAVLSTSAAGESSRIIVPAARSRGRARQASCA